MKFRFRIPNLDKRIAARTSLKRYVRQNHVELCKKIIWWLNMWCKENDNINFKPNSEYFKFMYKRMLVNSPTEKYFIFSNNFMASVKP